MDFRRTPSPSRTAAFLSSPTGMREGLSPSHVRAKALAEMGGNAADLFVAEKAWECFDNHSTPALEIASALMAQLRMADRVIFLLVGETRGAGMRGESWTAMTTFFELEIFQSIVLEKPTFILVHQSFDAAVLGPYLDLLDFAFPDWRDRAQDRMTDLGVIEAIKKIARGASAKQWQVMSRQVRSFAFHGALFRGRDRFLRMERAPIAHFMDMPRRKPAHGNPIDLATVTELLRTRKTFEEEEDNDRRLAYSWLLMRELLAEPLMDSAGQIVQRDPMLLSAWNIALGDWHGAASWNGLHSHIYLGTIPTLGTMEVVRNSLRATGANTVGQAVHFPGGAYASSYYSLSRRVPGQLRSEALEIAKKAITLESDPRTQPFSPGLQALMASIALEAGNPSEAVQIFENVLAFHVKNGSNSRAIGEVMCELAFARLFIGDARRAASEAAEGLHHLSVPGPNGKPVVDGFSVRATFKASIAHARAFQPTAAISLYRQGLRDAFDKRLYDQYEQWRPRGLLRRLWRTAIGRLRE